MATRMAEHIHENMGSMLVGVVISAVLLGVSLVQTFFYYISYKEDPWILKSLVAATAVLDSVHLAFISHTVYHYLISNYDNPASLEVLVWSVMEALCTGVTGCLVQCFYLTRVYLLSNRSKLLTGSILLVVLSTACMGTVWVILAMRLKTYDDLLTISAITISINALSTAADVVIAGSLCYMLHKARTGFKKSDSMINRLMLFVVNTGVLTSCCAIASLVALIASPLTLIYAAFYFCIGRLYTNSFLATLNARKTITGKENDVSHMLVSMPPTLVNSRHTAAKKSQQNISIRIDTTHERNEEEVRSHLQVHEHLDSKFFSDDELTQTDIPPRSDTKERDTVEYGSNYIV
ncbi:hypothetical protein FPV67DRAFT_1226533 [Lyophyllum atratum]|nr:hypothetical protein FPV67DRAFT_1226533 [Lyophyllum atratum]